MARSGALSSAAIIQPHVSRLSPMCPRT